MRVFTHCAQAIEGRHAQRGRKISVRSATNESFSESHSHIPGQRARSIVKRRAHSWIHRRTIESAADGEFCAAQDRPTLLYITRRFR